MHMHACVYVFVLLLAFMNFAWCYCLFLLLCAYYIYNFFFNLFQFSNQVINSSKCLVLFQLTNLDVPITACFATKFREREEVRLPWHSEKHLTSVKVQGKRRARVAMTMKNGKEKM